MIENLTARSSFGSHPSMAQIVLVGAGVAGLGTALSLGHAGHEVSILERDATPLPGPDRADPMADVPSARTPATGPGRCCARLRRLSPGVRQGRQ